MQRNTRLLLLTLPALLLVVTVSLAFFNAQRVLTRAARSPSTQHQLPFTLRAVDYGQAQPFEGVDSSPSFTTGAFFAGEFYLAGPAGLSIYTPDGTLRRTLRTGLELPVFPIVQVVSGRPRSASGPQLLLATAGAGVLILTPSSSGAFLLQQLLPSVPQSADLTTILPLASGDLLLGTRRHGVLLFSGSTLTPFRFTLPGIDAAALQVTALAAPDSSSILIGTRTAGIFYAHAGTVAHADSTTGLPDNQVEAIASAFGKAFAATPLGIVQFDLNAQDFRPTRTLAPGLFAHSLAVNDSATQLTVGTLDQGIEQISLGASASPHLRNASISAAPAPTSGTQRVDAFLNSAGFALADGALLRHTSSGWTPAWTAPEAPPATLTDRNISALAFDDLGRLYAGFFDRGLDVLVPQTSQPSRHFEDDHLFCVNRLVLDPRRRTIAAATANGLVLFDAQGVPRQTLTRRDGLISDHVSDIAFTRTGATVATPAGLTFITPAGTQSLYAFQGLVNNHVYALAGSPASDNLLAGTLGGLSMLQSDTVRRNFTVANSALRHNWITALAAVPEGGWLVGTYGAGLMRLSPAGVFSPIDLPANAPHDLVINPNALLVTPAHVFAGTLGHGFLMYTSATGRWTQIASGLPSLNVTAFAARNGELYIGTENGLVHIAEGRL